MKKTNKSILVALILTFNSFAYSMTAAEAKKILVFQSVAVGLALKCRFQVPSVMDDYNGAMSYNRDSISQANRVYLRANKITVEKDTFYTKILNRSQMIPVSCQEVAEVMKTFNTYDYSSAPQELGDLFDGFNVDYDNFVR